MIYLINPERIFQKLWFECRISRIDTWVLITVHYSHTFLTLVEIGKKLGITSKKPDIMQMLHTSINRLVDQKYLIPTNHSPAKYQLSRLGLDKFNQMAVIVETFINSKIEL